MEDSSEENREDKDSKKNFEYTAIIIDGQVCVVEKEVAEHYKKNPDDMKNCLPANDAIIEKVLIAKKVVNTPMSKNSKAPDSSQAKPTSRPKSKTSITPARPIAKKTSLIKTTSTSTLSTPIVPRTVNAPVAILPKPSMTAASGSVFIPPGTILFIDKNKYLLNLYKDNINMYNVAKMKRKDVWKDLSWKLKSQGINWLPGQVKSAWKYLMLKYAESLEDEEARKKFIYFVDMDEIQRIQNSLYSQTPVPVKLSTAAAQQKLQEKLNKVPKKTWNKTSVLQLIHSYQQRKEFIKSEGDIAASAWESITEEINAHGTDYLVEEVKNKWQKLTDLHTKINMDSENSEISNALINVLHEPGETVRSTLEALETLAAEATKQMAPHPPPAVSLDKHVTKIQSLMKKSKRLKVFGTIMDSLKETHTERLHESKLFRESRYKLHKQKMNTMVMLMNIIKEKINE